MRDVNGSAQGADGDAVSVAETRGEDSEATGVKWLGPFRCLFGYCDSDSGLSRRTFG